MDDAQDFRAATDDLTLAVDLDGTLVKTDLLFETFWSALSARWQNIIPAVQAFSQGRAPFKRRLEELGPVDVSSLPYNEEVITFVQRWRDAGGRTALVSASDQRVVDRVAEHLGIFDDVLGSDGKDNNKGERKAARLLEMYGPGKFAYIGDAEADLPVWSVSALSIGVDLPPSLKARLEGKATQTEYISTRDHSRFYSMMKALRPHQWLKNTLVFLPILAAHKLDPGSLGSALAAFVVYSLIASSVYLLNDLLDLSADRSHPRKRKRPFAAGTVPLAWGTVVTPLLLLLGFGLSLLLGAQFFAVMLFYFVMTTAYSLVLKRKLVVDICTLAGLYTLRIIAGGVATDTPLSVWLLAFSIFFFFSLASMKRQAELVSGAARGKVQAHGRGYRTTDMPIVANMAVSSGYLSVLVMALYLNTDAVRELYMETAPLWGICLVLLFWLSRMVMITHRGWMHDDPVVFAAKDRVSIVCVMLIFALAVAGVVL